MSARFGKREAPADARELVVAAAPIPRFDHPKVFCIDLIDVTVDILRQAGYRVSAGTFGTPYRVEASTHFVRPFASDDLTGISEQEVIVIQMYPPRPTDAPSGRPPLTTNEPAPWASCRHGLVDPRPLAAMRVRDDIDRILKFGGLVVCFAAPAWNTGLCIAEGGYSGLNVVREFDDSSAWSVARALDGFQFEEIDGEEIHPRCANSAFAPLTPHLQAARYLCTITPSASVQDRWFRLATNKFDDTVSGVLVPAEKREGCIVVHRRS
jgi:hypothetical protein